MSPLFDDAILHELVLFTPHLFDAYYHVLRFDYFCLILPLRVRAAADCRCHLRHVYAIPRRHLDAGDFRFDYLRCHFY